MGTSYFQCSATLKVLSQMSLTVVIISIIYVCITIFMCMSTSSRVAIILITNKIFFFSFHRVNFKVAIICL